MDKARLYQDGKIGEPVLAREIDDEPWWRRQKIPLICPFCKTRVVSQRTTVGRAPRGALFRLAADQQHEDICPLNPTEVLHKIARGSQGVAVIEGDELHLMLPDDESQLGAADTDIDVGAAGGGSRFGVDISTVGPLLPPLISSAVTIVRFLQKYGFDPDVVAQFKVRRPGEDKAVSWDEFCHGPATADYARLYARLTGGQPKPRHPVAVYGRIIAVERNTKDRPYLRLTNGRGFTVRIWSEHDSLLAPLAAGAFVLAVGTWDVWTPERGGGTPQLRIFAKEHWQLAHWTYDAATGQSSPPVCPPPLSLAQRTLNEFRTATATRKPAPGRTPRPATRPHPSGPPKSAAPPPNATSPGPPPTAPEAPATAASTGPPTPRPTPGPAVPDTEPPEAVPPARPSVPSYPAAPLQAASPPAAPPTTTVSTPSASFDPPTPITSSGPAVPDTAAVSEPALPAQPPVPPRPSTPPRPAGPPRRRTRRTWWPFGRRR